MLLPSTSRHTRVRRLLAVSAAAVAVMIAPTACDYGGYGTTASTGHGSGGAGGSDDMGDMPGMDHGSQNPAQQPVVVPVGNTVQSTPGPSADDQRRGDRRNHVVRRYWSRGYNGRPTSTTVPPPTTDPAAPVTDPAAPVTDPAVTTDPAAPVTDPAAVTTAPTAPPAANSVGPGGADGNNNGLEVLARDCSKSTLAPHDGFQKSPACVNTEMGEVAAKDKLPSLLIVDAPTSVGVGVAFTLKVSTRNLIRDRFLGAKAGGYYLEASQLDPATGLQRGHFHTACRILPNFTEAPDSSPDPEFFLATEDKGGSATPDVVTINVGAEFNKAPGNLQCTSWAGDGSHRTPMMTQANETPAIDSVRIKVTNDSAPPTGYVTAAGNDPAAAQADLAQQADAKQAEAGAQKPDVEKNGVTDTGKGGGAPAAAPPAPAADPAPVSTEPATSEPAVESTATEAPATN